MIFVSPSRWRLSFVAVVMEEFVMGDDARLAMELAASSRLFASDAAFRDALARVRAS